jgi:hypothetical protein
MSIFTCIAPIEISKRIMDYFLFENSSPDRARTVIDGERCLLQLLFRMLKFVQPRCLRMEEDELFAYLKNGKFIQDCFAEMYAEDMFKPL